MSRKLLLAGGVSTVAMLLSLAAQAQTTYAPGDWHNHTTCTDGSLSPAAMLTPPIQQFGLKFLIQTDHGGSGVRDCNYSNTSYNVTTTASSTEADRIANGALWVDTIGAAAIKGDPVTSSSNTNGRTVRAMWRWQNIMDYEYAMIRATQRSLGYPNMFQGYEQIVPGHEHATMSIIGQQTTRPGSFNGNAIALARWEYQYDRTDSDFSGGQIGKLAAGWNGTTDSKAVGINSSGATVIVTPSNFSTQNAGLLGHWRSVKGVEFLQANYPLTSFYTPSHVERAGVFNPSGNGGFNVEHFRDFNTAAPTVAIGFDTQPGHQASINPGEYDNCGLAVGTAGRQITCPATTSGGRQSVGGGAYGGTGIYGAQVGGLWDALLGEGRNFWFFGSSDFHNRGIYVPPAQQSTADFFPGEYQKTYFPAKLTVTPVKLLEAMRSGNAYTVEGDLIGNDLTFTASAGNKKATMGQTLVVPLGSTVTITVSFTLPAGPNNSPYSFNNPLLSQISVNQPLNQPVIDHMDLITGSVTGPISRGNAGVWYAAPTNTAYTVATNSSTKVAATYSTNGTTKWTVTGNKVSFSYQVANVAGPMYVRMRGTNIPAGTPNVTDAQGNPLRDDTAANVLCSDPACPSHLVGVLPSDPTNKHVGYDVRSWSNLWVYTNPIYIRTTGDAPLLAETNAQLATTLAVR